MDIDFGEGRYIFCQLHVTDLDSKLMAAGQEITMFKEDFVDLLDSLRCPEGDKVCEPFWYFNHIRLKDLQDKSKLPVLGPELEKLLWGKAS